MEGPSPNLRAKTPGIYKLPANFPTNFPTNFQPAPQMLLGLTRAAGIFLVPLPVAVTLQAPYPAAHQVPHRKIWLPRPGC